MKKPSQPQDTATNSRVVGGHEVADDDADKYDARGGQFFGPPGDYGEAQGWKNGKPASAPQAAGDKGPGYNAADQTRRHPGAYGGTGEFADQRGDAGFDPAYQQLREQKARAMDEEYQAWRGERYQKFADDFSSWRKARAETKAKAKAKDDDDGSTTRSK